MSDLEQDFNKVAEQINAKIAEAAKALKEANRLADEAGLEGLIFTQFTKEDIQRSNKYADEPLDDEQLDDKIADLEEKYELIKTALLENEMGNAGWNTSSSYC
jgi:hypothetical protein